MCDLPPIRLCGTLRDFRISRNAITLQELQDTNDSAVIQALYDEVFDHVWAEEGARVTFHLVNEACDAQRPLGTLVGTNPESRRIHVHTHRQAKFGTPLTANLSFEFDDQPQGFSSPDIWRDKAIGLSIFDTLESLIDHVQRQIARKLRRQQRLNRSHFRRGSENNDDSVSDHTLLETQAFRLEVRTLIHSIDYEARYIDLDEEDAYVHRIANICDLFQDPDVVLNEQLHITARISVSKLESSSDADVVERVRQPPKTPLYIHIANHKRQVTGRANDIAVEHRIFARLDEEREQPLPLYEFNGWDFGSFYISEPNDGKVVDFQPDDWERLPAFKGVEDEAEIEQVALQLKRNDTQIPFIPAMSFSSSASPSQARMSKSTFAPVVVRLVNHLPDQEAQDLDLDINCQLGAGSRDTAKSVEAAIMRHMQKYEDGGEQGEKIFPVKEVLFGALKDTWKGELWALPQHSKSTLYRFDGGVKFLEFMDQEKMKAGDRRVYMEYHIWPKNHETENGL